eukprot:TRINITY_DN1880_c0_g1_i5.p1 TRINITY_DN1880_c0_g1~~TRINITY_DN1880_c0_g1_i5.p1  ORF type:complete len:210 (-),score=38.29 TRINITY_DN1880_c0_g1_i5:113-742(-)
MMVLSIVLCFRQMERRFASGSSDCTIRIWDVSSGQCENTLQGHDWINSVVFSSNGTKIASGSNDCTIRIWDVSSGQCENTLQGHNNWVNSVVFSSNGTKIASGSNDCTVRLWDVRSGQCENTLQGHDSFVDSVVSGTKVSVDSKTEQNDESLIQFPLKSNRFGRFLWSVPDAVFSCEGGSVIDPVNLNANILLLLKQRGANVVITPSMP